MSGSGSIPIFRKSPLNEVALGIQFAPIRGYQQIHAGEVWRLYEERYPLVEEHPALDPAFEVFGGPPTTHVNFGLVGATHDRFWFISPDRQDLIQFQDDRLLHNWRSLGDEGEPYPRFEALMSKFQPEAEKLESYFLKRFMQTITVNQCEISYTNHIPVWQFDNWRPDAWINFLNTANHEVEEFHAGFRRITRRPDGSASGRLYCQTSTAVDQRGRPILSLALTARGVPSEPNLSGALEFLRESREMLVRLFAEVTTDSAHMAWERVR